MGTLAGTSTAGSSGNGGPATSAELNYPFGVAVDGNGNVYIADSGNNSVRVIYSSGTIPNVSSPTAGYIYTVAGGGSGCSGQTDSLGDGCTAVNAELDTPDGVSIDSHGNVFVDDSGDYRIREVSASTGVITTVVGGGTGCSGQSDSAGDGCPAADAKFGGPDGIAIDASDNLYIADTQGNRLRVVYSAGTIPNISGPQVGYIYSVAGNGTPGYVGDNGPATGTSPSTELNNPSQVLLDSSGNIYIADYHNNRIRVIYVAGTLPNISSPTVGYIYTVAGNGTAGFAGDDGPATSAELNGPFGIALSSTGSLYMSDVSACVIRQMNTSTGNIFTVAGTGACGYTGNGATATSSELHNPYGVALDTAGDLYIADDLNHRIRVVVPGSSHTPAIAWSAPAAITYGSALSATQLDATTDVPSNCTYSPVLGAALVAGIQTLSVTCTPSDTTNYTAGTATVSLTVNKAPLTITANNASRAYGATNPVFTASYSGFVNGDTQSVLTGSPSLTTTATTSSTVGIYTISAAAGSLADPNYTFSYVNGTLTVGQATPTISIGNIPTSATSGGSFTVTYSYSGTGSPTESVSSSTTSVCTVSGSTVNYVGAGTCTLTASASATTDDAAITGNAQSFTVSQVTLSSATIYSYTVPSGGFDGVGNITSLQDSVMGTWSFQYDTLNRLVSGGATTGSYAGQNACWSYDSFGNRKAQNLQTNACPTPESSVTPTASYNSNNQVTWTTVNSAVNGFTYDAAGNVQYDNNNYYAYDGEGRLCAIQTYPISGGTVAYGYIYDADGRRVAKGTITPSPNPITQPLSCDPGSNGFTLTESYVLDQSGKELTMLDGSDNWQRTNVYGAGILLATYDINGLHFQLTDPLGTRRMQTSAAGQPETDIQSLPYGDQLNPLPDQYAPATADDATPLHFTGKERDAESGNDYFGARYFGSSMGRFMSPDDGSGLLNDPNDPQSWNLYSYAGNNPLNRVDDDGHDWWLQGGSQCDQNGIQCDQQGYVLGPDGQRYTIQDQNLNQYQTSQGPNGTVNITTGIGTFTGTWFDSSPNAVSEVVPSDESIAPSVQAGIQQANAVYQGAKPLLYVMSGNALVGMSIPLLPMAGGSELISLGAGDELGITSNAAANNLIGASQRELLRQFFKTGKLPEGLTQGTLRIYKAIAERALQRYAAGGAAQGAIEEGTAVQQARIDLINSVLK